jgi:hypothetical protein
MVDIINNPESRTVERSDSSGWAVAVIVLILVIGVGAFVWARYYRAPAQAPSSTGGSNINVTVPPPTGGTGGGTTPPPTY